MNFAGIRENGINFPNGCLAENVVESDAKQFVSKADKETWNDKQSGTENISANRITETDTKKFVTPEEKSTWNSKQNTTDDIGASRITQDATHRMVSDTEKSAWNGKADGSHTHPASQVTAGTFGGKTIASMNGNDAQVRNIQISTTPIAVGSSLATGTIYIVYEG